MDQSTKDACTIAVLMLRLEESRIPRARRMLDKVNEGTRLSDSDIGFLKRVYHNNRENQSLIERNPDFSRLINKFMDLFHEIIEKGFANEKNQGPPS